MSTEFVKVQITGAVKDESGAAVSGAAVSLSSDASGTLTAADGSFSFETEVARDDFETAELIISGQNFSNLLVIQNVPAGTRSITLTAIAKTNQDSAVLESVTFSDTKTQTEERQFEREPILPTAVSTRTEADRSETPVSPQPIVPGLELPPAPLPTPGVVPVPEVPPIAPSAPQITSVAIPFRNAEIAWQSSLGASGIFRIYRASSASGPFDLIAELNSTSNTFSDSHQTSNAETLYYKVSAVDAGIESDASQAQLALPLADVDRDGCVDNIDFNFLQAALDSRQGDANFNAAVDFNFDGSITLSDAVIFTTWSGWCAS